MVGAFIVPAFCLILLVTYLLTRAVTQSETKGGVAMLIVAVTIVLLYFGHSWYMDIYAHFLCKREGGIRVYERHKVDGFLVKPGWCVGECFEEIAKGKYKFREVETSNYIREGIILPPGKYRYYKSQVGDPNCIDQEKVRFGYRAKLPDGVCISVIPVDKFLSKYVVEHKYYNRQENKDALSSYPSFIRSQRVISVKRIRSNEVIASDIIFDADIPWPFSKLRFLGASGSTYCIEDKGGDIVSLALQGEEN